MGKPRYQHPLHGLLLAASVLTLAACPQQSLVSSSPGTPAPETAATLTSATATNSRGSHSIPYEVCTNLPTWERSPETTHVKQLRAMPRYGNTLGEEPLKSLLKTFWSHEIISFTTYGLSARSEPLYLSGVWTALDETANCYEGDQPEQINAGTLAEVWLINHRIVDLQWANGQYTLVVEPTERGLQLVQFNRQEHASTLSLNVVTPEGSPVEAVAGDW